MDARGKGDKSVSPSKTDKGGMDATGMSETQGAKFKQAKGVITRKATETQLQKKLQIADNDAASGDKQGLRDLQRKDKDMKIQEEAQQDFWMLLITKKKEELEKQREEQDAELEELLNQSDSMEYEKEDSDEYQDTEELKNKLQMHKAKNQKSGTENTSWQIRCRDPWRIYWDYLIITVALYSTVIIPIQIGVNTGILGDAYLYIDIFTYILYVADLLINLRTTYIDNFGEEIRDNKKITMRYVISVGFWIDFFSLWAAPGIDNKLLQPLGILKLNRLLRLLGIISESNMEKGPKSMFTIVYYFAILIIYLHITGCLWFVIIHETYKTSDDYWDYLVNE